MSQGIISTDFHFNGQTGKYTGKVREVYEFGDKLAMIATDRISAFDVVLPKPIPHKGQVLNQLAAKFLAATADIVPNWVESSSHPNVTFGKRCVPFKVEMVIRGYLTGHAWREYREGKRMLCGVPMPEGMKENERFPEPIITPTTKADEGHDEDISREDILAKGIVKEEDYLQLEAYTRKLYQRGSEIAAERGLILVDTKYEFGSYNGSIYLIDEVHTPDSSRYFYAEPYLDLLNSDQPQKQLSKEFVRQWLISEGFQGKDGQKIPEMTEERIQLISDRYIELYENISGEKFVKDEYSDKLARIKEHITQLARIVKMDFKVDKYENYSIARINEEKVDSSVAPELKSEFMDIAQDGVKSLIVDMSGVKYVDSSGLSALLVGNRSFSEEGVFVLYSVNDHVMKLISISQLDKVMTIVSSQEEAADAVLLAEINKGQSAGE